MTGPIFSHLAQLAKNLAINEGYVLIGEFRIFLAATKPIEIKIKIWQEATLTPLSPPYRGQVSHMIFTPIQAEPYNPEPARVSPQDVIDVIVSDYTSRINAALAAGHSHDLSWLQPNPEY